MYTIILSGPGGFKSQALKALTDAGFTAHAATADHLLADHADGLVDPTVAFVSLTADDIDGPAAAVASLGWSLRAHYVEPKEII